MKDLIELTNLATQLHAGNFSVISSLGEGEKFQKLYEGIRKGIIRTEEEALNILYAGSGNIKTYHKLKERYKMRILSSLLHHDLTRYFESKYSKAIYRVMCNLFACEVAIMKGRGNAIFNILLKSLQLAEHFHLTYFEVHLLQSLVYRSSLSGREISYKIFSMKLKIAFPKYSAEVYSNQLSYQMTFEFAKSVSPTHKLSRFTDDVILMKKLAKQYNTFTLWLNYYRATIRTLHLKKQNNHVLKKCDEAISFLKSVPHIAHKERIGEFLLHKMDNAILAGNYKEAIKCYKEATECYSKDSYNQLVAKEYYFILRMHTGDFSKAFEIFSEAEKHPKYKHAPGYMKERWLIFKAHLYYAQPNLFPDTLRSIEKSLGKLEINLKDKTGFNISIYFANILMQLMKADLDSIELKKQSFYSYFQRHINKTSNPRAYYFSRLIKILIKHHDEVESVLTKSKPFLKEMRKYKNTVEFPEIIPYEMLWNLTLKKIFE